MATSEPEPVAAETLGLTYYAMGLVAEAEAIWLAGFEQALTERQVPTAEGLASRLTGLYLQQGRTPEAMKVMGRAMVAPLRVLWPQLIALSQVEREKLIRRHRADVDRLLSNLLRWSTDEAAATTAIDLMLWRRGLGLEPYRAANRAARRDPAIRAQVDAVKALRAAMSAELATHSFQPVPRHSTEMHWEGLRKSPEIDRLECDVFSRLTDEDCAAALQPPDGATVLARLPRDGAMVMYYRCRVTNPQNNQAARYLAMVLRPGATPQASLIDLGDATAIENGFKEFQVALLHVTSEDELPRGAMRTPARGFGASRPPDDRWRTLGRELRALILDPLTAALTGVTRLFIVPDGLLARLSFATLPADDGFLLDQYTISYLASGRELCEEEWTAEASAPMVVGAPDYDGYGAAPAPDSPPLIWFGDLPGSRAEGMLVATRLGVPAISGRAATRRCFTDCKSPVVLHVSTHGTLLPVDPRIAEMDWAAPFDPAVEVVGTVAFTKALGRLAGVEIEDQALRSILVTAGINTWLAGGELPEAAGHGWLNAEDIALMDLWGTQLVVLSACETGLGVIEIGETVLGVRSAFSVAGARTVVSTLWQVQDELVTPNLMLAFYDALADGTTGGAAALHRAQVAARRQYPHRPDWWGPFICHGGTGSLPAGVIQASAGGA